MPAPGLVTYCAITHGLATGAEKSGCPLLTLFLGGWLLLPVSTRSQSAPPPPAARSNGAFFGLSPDAKRTRHYYVAAEPELWDYAPEGRDLVCGEPLEPILHGNRTAAKLRYVQYTDETFKRRARHEPNLGILGPVLRGVVGDRLKVTFLNRTTQPLSMHPHGVKYDKESEGAFYLPKPGAGAAVQPGASFTYVWLLDEQSGPLPSEPSSKAWLYHSHVVNSDDEINRGLIGFIIVTDPHRARPDATPSDVDRELASLFMVFDESDLTFTDKALSLDAVKDPSRKSWAEVQRLLERGARYTINGRVFGNLRGLEMREDERVRWYLLALGSERDLHSAHWHGLRVLEDGRRRTDVVELLPASMKVTDFKADNPGTWLFHCHVSEHMMEGMFTTFTIHPRGSLSASLTGPAFFGLPANCESLRIARAEIFDPPKVRDFKAFLAGSVTFPETANVLTQAFHLQIGQKTLASTPGREGWLGTEEGWFHVLNADAFNRAPGGVLEFEALLNGEGWRAQLAEAPSAVKSKAPRESVVTVQLTIGDAEHTGAARMIVVDHAPR